MRRLLPLLAIVALLGGTLFIVSCSKEEQKALVKEPIVIPQAYLFFYTFCEQQDANTYEVETHMIFLFFDTEIWDTFDTGRCDLSFDSSGEADPRPNMMSNALYRFSASAQADSRGVKPMAQGPNLAESYPFVAPVPLLPLVTKPAANPSALASLCDSSAGFYEVNHTNGTVTHYLGCPLKVLGTIPVRSNPLQVALTPDATLALVTSYDSAVNFIDTTKDQVVFTLDTGSIHPSGIAISPDGARAYVTNYFDTGAALEVIDIIGRKIIGSVPLPVFPKNVFLTPDGNQAWVNYVNSNTVSIIDTLTMTVTNNLNVGSLANQGIGFSPTGTRAYIAASPNLLQVYDTATLDSAGSITVDTKPVDVLVSPDGGTIAVTCFGARAFDLVDTAQSKVVFKYSHDGAPAGLTVLPVAR